MSRNAFFDAINGYESTSDADAPDTGKRFFLRTVSGTVTHSKKRLSSTRPVRFIDWLSKLVSYSSTKAYGAAFLAFGLLTIFLHFSRDLIGAYTPATDAELIIGIVLSVLSIPLLLFDRPMCIALQDFSLTDFLLFEFFCIKRMHKIACRNSVPTVLAILLGIIPAALGYFVPIETVTFVLISVTVIAIAFISPEFSLLASFIILPYVSYLPYESFIIPAIIIVTVISLFRKVYFGKRYLNIEQYDILLGILMSAVLTSGIFIKGVDSFTSSLGMIVLMLGYTLCSNLVANRRLADRAMNAIIVSSIPAFIATATEFVRAVSEKKLFDVLQHGLSGSFDDPAEYAAFLVVILTLTVAGIKQSHGGERLFYVGVFLFNLFSLVLTAQRFAAIVLIIGFIAYFALKLRAAAGLILPILFVIPYAVLYMPSEMLDVIFAETIGGLRAGDLFHLWRTALDVLRENLWVGIGIGEVSFGEEFAGTGYGGITDTHNIFLELGLEAGVIALVCFVVILLVRLRHRAAYYKYTKNSQVSTLSPIISVAIFALITLGATNYIWSDVSTAYLFWSVLGIGSATLRVAKQEHDDRVLYYDGARSASAAVLELDLD